MKRGAVRVIGNWITGFLSPLIGTSTAFHFTDFDFNVKLILSALIASTIVTGLVIAKEMEAYGKRG